MFNREPLHICDKELYDILEEEKQRQKESINLIASENYVSNSIYECLGSCTVNKYSEGYPGKRYYGGNDIIDKLERLCQKRALEAFRLNPEEWGVNVQSLSGSPANVQAIYALVGMKGKILGMSIFSGGHLTHGHRQGNTKISITSDLFESEFYECNKEGYIDYEKLKEIALSFKPQLIICGYSSYSRDLNYKKFREICNEIGAYLLCDISHYAGFVITQMLNNPFEYADVVTTTTHKTMRSARSALIFYNKKKNKDLENKINSAVFPCFQGGPHNNQIAAAAHQLKEVITDSYKNYMKQILLNSKALANYLIERNIDILTNGTDNHIIIISLKKFNLTGSKVQEVSNLVNVALNKNTIPDDTSCGTPKGIRIGTPAITTRGAKEKDMEFIAEVILKVINICIKIQEQYGKMLVDFKKGLVDNAEIDVLKKEVIQWASKFPVP